MDPEKQCCGRCQGKLIEIEVPGSKGDNANVGYTPKKRKTTKYALFVKDQSANARKNLARNRGCTLKEVSQADVMKECGKLWRSQKALTNSESEKDGLESMTDRLVGITLGGPGSS